MTTALEHPGISVQALTEQLASAAPQQAAAAEAALVRLADAGDLAACDALVSAYSEGRPALPPNPVKEYRYTARAAEGGSAFHRYWLAHLQYHAKDYPGAYANASLAHQENIGAATDLLARMLLQGQGCHAQPLAALDMLTHSVESRSNTDAALTLAMLYLEGQHVGAHPQAAYDTLHGLASDFAVIAHIDKPAYARYCYLKAWALRGGAQGQDGETWLPLCEKAAALGHADAKASLAAQHRQDAGRQRAAQWEGLQHFTAFGGRWMMFYRVARLAEQHEKSHQHVGSINGNVYTTTSRWNVLVFAERDGSRFEVKVPPKAKVVPQRDYAVLFIGPATGTVGVPRLIYDLGTGESVEPMGDLPSNYRDESSKVLKVLSVWAWLGAIIAVGVCLSQQSAMALLAAIGLLVAGVKLGSAHRGQHDDALERVRAFFKEHAKDLVR